MNTKKLITALLAGVVCLLVFSVFLSSTSKKTVADNGVSLHTELGGSAEGYQRVCGSRELVFPQDHGAHPSFRNEWWYMTGNLTSEENTKFGFHITFFRIANRDNNNTKVSVSEQSSLWATSEFYMAHFAITQEGTERTLAHERFARAAAGLAGAKVTEEPSEQQPLVRVWLDDWQLLAEDIDGELVWQLSLSEGTEKLELSLSALKPLILQGKEGYSQKSADPCNASRYYSLTRLQANGDVSVAGVNHRVTGSAWLDREWSSSALADDQVGWDWFALQLNDGREIMFYQLRKADGSTDPYSHAVEIDQLGVKTELPQNQISLEVDDWWQSASGAKYPVGGRIQRADNSETYFYRPLVRDQELDLTVRYWEGAIVLSNEAGEPIGHGYLELTGY